MVNNLDEKKISTWLSDIFRSPILLDLYSVWPKMLKMPKSVSAYIIMMMRCLCRDNGEDSSREVRKQGMS